MLQLLVALVALATCVSAFAPRGGVHGAGRALARRDREEMEAQSLSLPGRRARKEEIMQAGMFVGPQIAFVATIVGAFVAYIAANLDDIKAKQKIATDEAMAQQSSSIRSAMSKQDEAIRLAKESQAKALRSAQQAAEAARLNAEKYKP